MFTEQEAVAKLNEKIAKGQIKQSTRRYLDKIRIFQSRLTKQRAEVESLRDKIKALELEERELRGAISVLLELAAEDEGMLESPEPTEKLSTSIK